MKKYIELSEEVIARLVSGKCVEGSLRRDEWTGKVTFRAFNRQPRKRFKDKFIKKLPWGWLKESQERIRLFGSFPKDMGTATIMGLMEEHTHDAKNAMIEREIIDFV
jgi:hypothetical protein